MENASLLLNLLSLVVSLAFMIALIIREVRSRRRDQRLQMHRAALFDEAMQAQEELFADTPEESALKQCHRRTYRSVTSALENGYSIKTVHLNREFMRRCHDVQNDRYRRLGLPTIAGKLTMFCGFPVVESDTVEYGDYLLELGEKTK